jgi:nitrate reductase gamma subunit
MFALVVLAGLITLFRRRLFNQRLKVVTTRMDIAVELLLIAQVVIGIIIALTFRWGSSWFAAVLTPYLRSIVMFHPDIAAVGAMPWLVKLHIIGAYLTLMLIPFSRLVHILVVPLHYIWRPYQVVIWSWNRRKVRRSSSEWTATRPTNT